MCGLCGYLALINQTSSEELFDTVLRMTHTLRHRGPDDSGVWVNAESGIALGHRRLSVIDLSAAGKQPMHSACGRYVIVYNGEVYNHQDLSLELADAGAVFKGHSDTEVILAAISCWGIPAAVQRFNGMFAFSVWDRKERVLWLARDRMGEKPLYYGEMNGIFLFGSELKPLRAHPLFRGEINRGALALLMRHNCIPAPYSIFSGISKLLPGTILSVRVSRSGFETSVSRYWSLKEAAESGVRKSQGIGEEEAISRLESLLLDAIRMRMAADVPVGAFLSGGIDSSTVVALMQTISSRPVRTFTIGYSEADYDEAKEAKQVASHLGTEHTELYVTPAEAMAVIPGLPTLYDEPFSDSSQIPTFLVSRLTRGQVTVSLSGDGGDELFGGYNRHVWCRKIWNRISACPEGLRKVLAGGISRISAGKWESIAGIMQPFLPARLRQRDPVGKLRKIGDILTAETLTEVYHILTSHWQEPELLVIDGKEPLTLLTDSDQHADVADFVNLMMYLDMMTYLPDDILVKMDRASMGVGLEARIPMLDHRLVEFAWQVPLRMKIHNGQGKWILRQVLCRHVPKEMIERPKMGFAIPIDVWLRGPLRDWAEDLLDPEKLREQGFFNECAVREKWEEHLSGHHNWHHHLWDVLMFQAWRKYSA